MKNTANLQSQTGATLIEVLVTILILSIGLLAMGAMISYSILLPKFSGNRSVAISTAGNMIDRMRSNAGTESPSFSISSYATTTFSANFVGSASIPAGATCSFPNCTQATMATMDIAIVQQQLQQQLSPAGMTITVTNVINNEGSLWVVWREPASVGSLAAGSDNCPPDVTALALTPAPRCIYMPFKL